MRCKLKFVLTKRIVWYNCVMGVLLMANLEFKIMNSVTLLFRNTEICSRNYLASSHSKHFWINVLWKKDSFNFLNHTSVTIICSCI